MYALGPRPRRRLMVTPMSGSGRTPYPAEMDTIFGAAWDQLRIDHLTQFLADAGDEPLRWEAKSDGRERLSRRSVREQICAFANSRDGGWLILGASGGEGRPWSMAGLTNPRSGSLATWVSQAADQVSPRPAIDVRTFRSSPTRGPVAVVWIPPVDVPPAITTDGVVLVRVAGSSQPVRDPRVLAELYASGETALESAAARSLRATNAGSNRRSPHRILSMGAAAVGVTEPPIYQSSFIDRLDDVARSELGELVPPFSVGRSMDHEKVWIGIRSFDDWRGDLQIFRDGSAGVHVWCPEGISFASTRGWAAASNVPAIERAYASVTRTLALAGGTGRVHVRLSVLNQHPSASRQSTDLERWAHVGDPPEQHVEPLRVDLQRSDGAWITDA